MASVAAALGGAARASIQLDRPKIALDVAARGTIGVAIPLIGAQLLGYPVDGVTASIGALSGGFASFQGTYRSRAGAVLAASVGMALSAFVGATVGHVIGIDLAVTALWGFAAGLLVCLGPTATVSGVQSVVGLVVFSQFHLSATAAIHTAGLVLLGGLIQAFLVVVVWPLRRFPAERRALSDVYGQLATDAGQLPVRWTSRLVPGAFDQLHDVLRDPQPFGGALETAAHSALAAQAERIRLETVLGVLTGIRTYLQGVLTLHARLPDTGVERPQLNDFANEIDDAMSAVADGLRSGGRPMSWPPLRSAQQTLAENLGVGHTTGNPARRPGDGAGERDGRHGERGRHHWSSHGDEAGGPGVAGPPSRYCDGRENRVECRSVERGAGH